MVQDLQRPDAKSIQRLVALAAQATTLLTVDDGTASFAVQLEFDALCLGFFCDGCSLRQSGAAALVESVWPLLSRIGSLVIAQGELTRGRTQCVKYPYQAVLILLAPSALV